MRTRTFNIQTGTPGLLIIQEKDVDATIENFSVRKNLTYNESNVLVDPAKIQELGKLAYEPGSIATRLAQGDYFVFSDVENQESKYMIAIQANQLQIS